MSGWPMPPPKKASQSLIEVRGLTVQCGLWLQTRVFMRLSRGTLLIPLMILLLILILIQMDQEQDHERD
jgi:hypothetical protein